MENLTDSDFLRLVEKNIMLAIADKLETLKVESVDLYESLKDTTVNDIYAIASRYFYRNLQHYRSEAVSLDNMVDLLKLELAIDKCGCQNCGNKTFTLNLGNDVFCKECIDNNFSCSQCGGCFNYDNMDYHNIGDDCLCDRCYNRFGSYCESCDRNYYSDVGCSCDDEQNSRDYDDEVEVVKFKEFNKGKILTVNRGCGIELEFSTFDISNGRKLDELRNKYLYLTSDGSVNGAGVEVVTNVMKGKLVETTLKSLFESVDVDVDKSCGLHVHINTSDFTPLNIKHLFRSYQNIENAMFSLVPQSRQENRFCYKFDKIYGYNENFDGQRTKYDLDCKFYGTKDKRTLKYRKEEHYNSLRYAWANFHSLLSKGNVEIRLHAGTGNYEKIVHWVALNVAIVSYVRRHGMLKVFELKALLFKLLQKNLITNETMVYYIKRQKELNK